MPTVESVKHKVGIPADNIAHDEHVQACVLAALARAGTSLGIDFEATTGRQDIFQNVKVGREIILTRRPVLAVTACEARSQGSASSYSPVSYDLFDAARGRLVIAGWTDAGFPPQDRPPSWSRWRDQIFDFVRVTYNTSAYVPPGDLDEAINELAAYWYTQSHAGAVSDQSIGGVSQSFRDGAMPESVSSVFASYQGKRRASWV